MKVGFTGLGNMGQGMADNLLKQGFDLCVFTCTRSKVEAMTTRGAVGADSAGHLTREVDMVLVCLPDVPTVTEVFLGEVIAAARPRQIPQGEVAEHLYALASRKGMAEQNITALYLLLEQKQAEKRRG